MASSREGSPLVALEALLCGMAVISTPTDGIIDKIKIGKNGYLFPFYDVAFLDNILKYTDENQRPRLNPKVCRDSVCYVLNNKPLKDMWEKIKAVHIENIGIMNEV